MRRGEPMLDLPSEFSYEAGRSIVRPVKSKFPIGSPEWMEESGRRMQKLKDRATSSGDWEKYVFLHVRGHRWRALDQIAARVPPRSFPRLFRKVWMDSENIYAERRRISRLIKQIRPEFQRTLFEAADRKRFDSLPERFTVYRGAKAWNLSGMSWTLDIDRAVYFATHHYDDGMAGLLPPDMFGVVLERSIRKDQVLFYSDDRHEEEVVLKRFASGQLSPEGMLWTAESKGKEAFAAEFEIQKELLSPEAAASARQMIALMNHSAE